MVLNNLGNLDRAVKHLQEARQRDDEALKIYRHVAESNPETYLPDSRSRPTNNTNNTVDMLLDNDLISAFPSF